MFILVIFNVHKRELIIVLVSYYEVIIKLCKEIANFIDEKHPNILSVL